MPRRRPRARDSPRRESPPRGGEHARGRERRPMARAAPPRRPGPERGVGLRGARARSTAHRARSRGRGRGARATPPEWARWGECPRRRSPVEDYRHEPREGGGGHGTVPPEQRKSCEADAPDLRGQERDERESGEKHEEQDGPRESHDGRMIANRGRMTEGVNRRTG